MRKPRRNGRGVFESFDLNVVPTLMEIFQIKYAIYCLPMGASLKICLT